MKKLVFLALLAGIIFVAATQVTVFVIEPFGFVTDGMTLFIPRGEGMGFLESAESYCADRSGPSNYFCQGQILSEVTTDTTILVRVPYIGLLKSISMIGVE